MSAPLPLPQPHDLGRVAFSVDFGQQFQQRFDFDARVALGHRPSAFKLTRTRANANDGPVALTLHQFTKQHIRAERGAVYNYSSLGHSTPHNDHADAETTPWVLFRNDTRCLIFNNPASASP